MAVVTNGFTDTIAVTYTGDGKAVSTKTGTYTGKYQGGVAGVAAAGLTTVFTIAVPHTTIQAFIIASTQDVTVDVNSTVTPVPSLAVKSTQGVTWGADYATASPLTADIVTMHVINGGTADAKFDFRVVWN